MKKTRTRAQPTVTKSVKLDPDLLRQIEEHPACEDFSTFTREALELYLKALRDTSGKANVEAAAIARLKKP